jgi:hypothetical protein
MGLMGRMGRMGGIAQVIPVSVFQAELKTAQQSADLLRE